MEYDLNFADLCFTLHCLYSETENKFYVHGSTVSFWTPQGLKDPRPYFERYFRYFLTKPSNLIPDAPI